MPLFLNFEEKEFRISIWKTDEEITELLSKCFLSGGELQQLNSFQSHFRKKEWLCTRIMLQQMLGTDVSIIYDNFGKPHLNNSLQKISVSHTKDFVAVLVSTTSHAGVDIERINPRIEKIAPKFLSEKEQKRIPKQNPLHYYYIVWGAKEVLFKIYGKGELLFKEHLLTNPFTPGVEGLLNASIKKNSFEREFQISYKFIDDLLLTYSIS